MTYKEARMILDLKTSTEYLRKNNLGLEDIAKACRVACEALDKVINLEEDLRVKMLEKLEDDLK